MPGVGGNHPARGRRGALGPFDLRGGVSGWSSLALRLGLAVQYSPGYAHEQEEGDANGASGAATFDYCVHSTVKPTRWVEML